MSDVVFVQKDNTFIMELGILLSTLEADGHQAALLSVDHEEETLYPKLEAMAPKMIGVYSDVYDLYKDYNFFDILELLEGVRRQFPDAFLFVTGVQPAMYPELLEKYEFVDCFIIGDAEVVVPKVLRTLKEGGALEELDGVAVYKNGEIILNRPTEYADFSELPLPDIDAFTQYPGAFRYGHRVAFARGCPNSCSFCFNHVYKANYAGESVKLPKYYPAEYLTRVCELLVERDPTIPMIYFTYSTFTQSKQFFKEFVLTYKARVGLPYIITTRLDCVDDEIAELLKESGCSKVTVGIESGNEVLRNGVLKKSLSTEALIDGMRALKENGVRVGCNFVMGFPGETLENAFESLDLHKEIRGDFLNISMFAPMPSLELTKLAKEQGYLDGIDTTAYSIARPNINTPDIGKIRNLSCLAPLYLRISNKTLFRLLCKLPHNPLFELVKYAPRIAAVLRFDLKSAGLWTRLRYFAYAAKTAARGIRPKSSYQ